MHIPNLGRLIGAGLLALGLHALTPGVADDGADRLDTGALGSADRSAASGHAAGGALVGAQATLSPAGERRSTESRE